MIQEFLGHPHATIRQAFLVLLFFSPAFIPNPLKASTCVMEPTHGMPNATGGSGRGLHEQMLPVEGKGRDVAIEDPAARVRAVYRRLAQVRYYQAQALIRADIPQVKMGEVRAEVEFTAPDQLKIRSTSLALLPKQGFSEFARMITDSSNFTAVDGGIVRLGTRSAQLITVVPGVGMPPDLMLARLWLDERQPLVLRAEMTTRSRGTVQVDYTYGAQAARALPDLMVFTMDVRNVKIPKAMTADLHKSNSSGNAKDADANRPAVVRVELSNYRFSR